MVTALKSEATRDSPPIKALVGRLLDHGAAPHRHIRGNSLSYYLVIETSRGREVLWNPGLHAALHQARAQIGDQVTIIDKGVHPPTHHLGPRARDRSRPSPRWLITRHPSRAEDVSHLSQGQGWRGAPQRIGTLLHGLASRIASRVLDQAQDRQRFVALVSARTPSPSPSSPTGAMRSVQEKIQARVAQVRQHAPAPRFDDVHLRDIHAALFRGLTLDAGHFRVPGVAAELASLGAAARSQGYFATLPREQFSHRSAALFRDILSLRPFDHGNTPTAMLFIEQLAHKAGHSLDLFARQPALNAALRDALTAGDIRSLERTILDGIKPARTRGVSREAVAQETVSPDSQRAPAGVSLRRLSQSASANRQTSAGVSRDFVGDTRAAMSALPGRLNSPRSFPDHVR